MEELRELNNEIGEHLEESTRKALKVLGYSVVNHRVSDSGIDVLGISKDGQVILAIECLNWSKWSYANSSRLRSLLNNFNEYPDAVRVLLTSFNVLTKGQKAIMQKHRVFTVEIDEQVLSSGKREIVKILNAIYQGVISIRSYYSSLVSEKASSDILNVILVLNGDSDLVQKPEESIEVDANTLQIIPSEEPRPNSLDDSLESMVNHEIKDKS